MAAIETEGILELVKALAGHLVAAVGQPAISLEQNRRTKEFVAVPPVRRTAGGAASAQNALVEAIELCAIFGRLQPLLARWLRRYRLEPGFDGGILCVEMSKIGHKVFDDFHMWQGRQRDFAFAIFNRCGAGKAVLAIDVHRAGTTNPFAA